MADQSAGRRARGFRQTGSLVSRQIRTVSERRGFAETRLLTDWTAICGPELAAKVTPVRVSYSRGGMGATLVVLCDGARAPEITMQRETIRARVNACYGYNAISRVQITQTAPGMAAPAGFAEERPHFEGKPTAPKRQDAEAAVGPIADDGLRAALQRLGDNVLSRKDSQTRKDKPE